MDLGCRALGSAGGNVLSCNTNTDLSPITPSQESTQSLQDLDSGPGIVGRMMLHVMSTGHGRSAPSPIGLCGAKVAGLYFSKLPGDGRRGSHLCPACKALAAAKGGRTDPAPPARAASRRS